MGNLIGLAALWVLWLLLPYRRRRRWRWGWILAATVMLLVSPLGANLGSWGLTAFLPPDSGERVDAIVVLGRGDDLRDRRIVAAWQLWRADRAPEIFASGMLDARYIVQELHATGVDKYRLEGEECSQTTEENALFTAALLYPKGVKRILLVTDSPHMLRSLRMFQSFGFRTIPYPIPLSDNLQTVKQFPIIMREYAALVQYTVSGRFHPRPSSELIRPSPAITQKIQEWNCQVPGTAYVIDDQNDLEN